MSRRAAAVRLTLDELGRELGIVGNVVAVDVNHASDTIRVVVLDERFELVPDGVEAPSIPLRAARSIEHR